MTEEDESELGLDVDLNLELDNYLLHPQAQRNLRIVHAFMQSDRKIEHACEEIVPIEHGTLVQEKLIWCIKQQQRRQREECNVHFKLRGMFLYNMDIHPEEVPTFLCSNDNTKEDVYRFLVPISALDNIVIQPTIPMFARLTALHILYEASPSTGTGTNKANAPNVPTNHDNHDHAHSKKKVVRIHSSLHKRKHKRTRKA